MASFVVPVRITSWLCAFGKNSTDEVPRLQPGRADKSSFCPHCGRRLEPATKDEPGTAPGVAGLRSSDTGNRSVRQPTSAPAAAEAGIYTEEELWTGRYSPKAMLGTWIMTGLIAIGLVILGVAAGRREVWMIVAIGTVLMWAIALAIMFYRRLATRYRLTTQRLILESGVVRLTTDRIDIIDINDITVEQGLIGRLLQIGTIIVRSNDQTHDKLHMEGIEDVNHVADLMDNARRAVQRRRGLRIDVNAPSDAADPTQ